MSYRALLIEDNPGDVRLVREMLCDERGVRLELDFASTLADALQRLERGHFDVVLVDLGLPDSTGLETFSRLHDRFPRLAAIVLTGNADIDLAVKAVQAGAEDYLVKAELSGSALVRALQYAIERKRTEEALRTSESLYRGIVESTDEGICIVDREGRLTYANARLGKLEGYSTDEIVGRPMFDFMDDDAASVAADRLRRTLQGSTERFEIRLRARDGSSIWSIVTATPLKDESGNYAGALVVLTDITERYRAEEVRSRLAAIVQSSCDAIIGTSFDGAIATWNSGAKKIYGFTAAEVTGKSIKTIAPPERAGEIDSMLETLRRGESIESFDTVCVTRDGRRINVSMTMSPIRDAGGTIAGFSGVIRDVTERKRVEERFRAAAECLSDVIYEWDLGNNLTTYGDVDRVLGYGRGEFPKTMDGWAAMVHPDDYLRVLQAIDAHLRGDAPYNVEYRMRRKDGSYAVWVARGQVVRDDRGVPLRWIGAVTDVTARRQAEDALRASEENYRRLIDNIPDVTWSADAHGNVTFVTANVEQVYGFTAEEMVRGEDHWRDRIHPDDVERIRGALAALYEEGKAFDEEYRLRRKDGRWIWIHDRSLGTYERNGTTYADGIFNEVTRRKEAELALHEVARERELLLESTGDGIYAVGLDGLCTMANRTAALLLGREIEDLLGQNMHELVHPRKPDGSPYPMSECAVDRAMREGKPSRVIDEVLWRKDGSSFPAEYIASPIIDDGIIRGAVVTFSDVTERRKLERRFEQVSRISSLGRMAATIAHEFNNVLMGIQPFAEIVRARAGEDPKLQQAATHILNSVGRGKSVTQDIMRVTRPAEPVLQSVDVAEWLNGFMPEIRGLVPQPVQIDLCLPPPGALFARCDPVQMQQVITNLALNARDAMAAAEDATLTIAAAVVADAVRLIIADNGCGIAPESLPFIFEPLFSTKKSGTGLGLAVAQQVVIRNGGVINVDSVAGKGTRFSIELPPGQPAVPSSGGEEHLSPGQFGVQRVLIVEDDPAVASGLAAVLELEEVHVRVVERGGEAMAAVEVFDPDIVVIDISLPDMTGTAVYEQLAARHPGIPVIFSTGHAEETILPQPARDHVGFLRKPYSIETLLTKMREMGVAGAREWK